MTRDDGVSGVVAGIMLFIIVVASAISFIMLTDLFNKQYDAVNSDPINSTGIMANNTTSYNSVKTVTTGIIESIPVAILLAFLIAAILVVLLVWAMVRNG